MNGPGTVNNRTQVQVPLDQNETIYIDNVMPNVFNTAVAVLKTGTTVDVEKFLGGIPNQTLKVRVEGAVTLKYNIGGMGSILTNTGADKLLFAGRIYGFTYVNDNWYEQDDSATGGGGGTTNFPLTINNSNTGVASPGLFDGSVGVTISANTVGAVSLSGSYSDPAWITTLAWSKITGAPGFVVGPASATDNALARYDLTTGKLIQNSNAILEDNGVLKVAAGILVGTGTVSQNDPQDSNFAAETLYIDSPNSRVGIGTDTPEATLSIHSQGTGNVRGVSGRHWDNSTAFSHFKYIGGRARGSVGSPSAVLSQDSLVGFIARGYKATDWSNTVGGLYIYAEANWTNSSTPTSIRLRGVESGTTVTEWFKFDSLGVTRSVASDWKFTQTTSNNFVFSTNSIDRLTVGSTVTVNGAMSIAGGLNVRDAFTTSTVQVGGASLGDVGAFYASSANTEGIFFGGNPNSVPSGGFASLRLGGSISLNFAVQSNYATILTPYRITRDAFGDITLHEFRSNTEYQFRNQDGSVTWATINNTGFVGTVTGPASATDNAVARFDLTTGKLIQNSAVTIADTGAMSIAAGSTSPALTVTTTGTDALRLAYDGSNRADFRVESNGRCVFAATGTAPSFLFANPMAASLTDSGNYTLDFVSTSSAGTSNALGLRMTARNASTSGTVLLRAMQASVDVTGAGGTTTNAIAIQANVTRTNGTLTNGYGLYVDTISGTMTNAYGIRVFDVTGGSSLNYAIYTGSGLVRFGDTVNIATTNGLQVNGTKVVGAQGATVADPAGGGTIDTEARTAINEIIDRLQAHGLIA